MIFETAFYWEILLLNQVKTMGIKTINTYSRITPGALGRRASAENPLALLSAPRGCLMTVNFGPPSSMETVLNLLINRSGLASTGPSLKRINVEKTMFSRQFN